MGDRSMLDHALPHEEIQKIFHDIFFVIGTSITHHGEHVIQHSSNMTIVRRGDELTLINTIRLNEKGLQQLEGLGMVKNIIRLGAFHGQDDAFYRNRYRAKLWSLKGMKEECGQGTDSEMDVEIVPNGQTPFSGCCFYVFETSSCPEAVLHIDQEGGILVVCDCVKNWLSPDQFFSATTAQAHQQEGMIGPANIAFWCNACGVKRSDFSKLLSLSFQHLLSAHGEPIRKNAHELLSISVKRQYSANS